MREGIRAETKLHVTLEYLATGDSITSLQYLYRVPKGTISLFLPEVLDAIYKACEEAIHVCLLFYIKMRESKQMKVYK